MSNNLGLVANAKDYSKLKENIRYAADHPNEVYKMSLNCIQAAKNKFNLPKQIAALNDFLKDHLQG